MKNNERVCLHPDLVCDGHKHCDDGQDENLDLCYVPYVENSIIQKSATFNCPNVHYPTIQTVATVCDGITECFGNLDEKDCNETNEQVILLTVGTFLTLYLALRNGQYFYRLFSKERRQKPLKMRQNRNIRLLQMKYRDHGKEEIILNAYLLNKSQILDRKGRSEVGCRFYAHFEERHGSTENIFCFMHNKLAPLAAKMISDAKFPGFTEKNMKWYQNIKYKLEKKESYNKIVSLVSQVLGAVYYYFDFYKDINLFIIVYHLNGGWQSLVDYPSQFTSIMIFCLGTSTFLPLLVSSAYLISDNVGNINKLYKVLNIETPTTLRTLLMKMVVLAFSFINPLIVMAWYEHTQEMTRKNAREISTKTMEYLKKANEIKSQYVQIIKITLSMEHFFQTFLQALLVLLARSRTPTTKGLKVFFTKSSTIFGIKPDVVLVYSLVLGLKSCMKLHVSAITKEKTFLPFKANVVCHCWAAMATAKRVISLVSFFIPSMGLCSILYHWMAEQIKFDFKAQAIERMSIKPNDPIDLYNTTRRVLWPEIDRFDYTDPSSPIPPDYTFYTGINLMESTILFGVLMICHFLITLIVKAFTVDTFKKKGIFNMFVHIIYAMNIASPAEDWDQGDHSVEEFKKRHERVNREMNCNIAVNFFFALLLTCPLLYTGFKNYFQSRK